MLLINIQMDKRLAKHPPHNRNCKPTVIQKRIIIIIIIIIIVC